jgi:hypothetical protein
MYEFQEARGRIGLNRMKFPGINVGNIRHPACKTADKCALPEFLQHTVKNKANNFGLFREMINFAVPKK